MASDTITTGLKNYAIGSKLRRLRLRKSMGLVELGKHTGLSPALLSKLERDVMHPTLPTLLRIAMVFSVGLEYFFNPEPKPVLEIVRKKDRLRFPDSPDGRKVSLLLREPGFPGAQPRAEFLPGRIRADHGRGEPGSTNTPASNSCTFCPAGWNCASEKTNTSYRKAIPSTSIPPCRMATAEAVPSAQQRSW